MLFDDEEQDLSDYEYLDIYFGHFTQAALQEILDITLLGAIEGSSSTYTNTLKLKTAGKDYTIEYDSDNASIRFKTGEKIVYVSKIEDPNARKDLSALIAKKIFEDNAAYLAQTGSDDLPILASPSFLQKNPAYEQEPGVVDRVIDGVRGFYKLGMPSFRSPKGFLGYLSFIFAARCYNNSASLLTNILNYIPDTAARILEVPKKLLEQIGLGGISIPIYDYLIRPTYNFIFAPFRAFASLFTVKDYLPKETELEKQDKAGFPEQSLVTKGILYARGFLKNILRYPGDVLNSVAYNIPLVSPIIEAMAGRNARNWLDNYIIAPIYKYILNPVFDAVTLPVVGFANLFSAPNVPYRKERLLALAAKSGDRDRVRELLADPKIDPNVRLFADDPYSSPLMYAIEDGNEEMVNSLLQSGKCDVREDREIAYLDGLPKDGKLTEDVVERIKGQLQEYINRMTFAEKAKSFNRNFFGTTLPVAVPSIGYYLRTRLLYPGLPYYLPTGIAKGVAAIGRGIVGLFIGKPSVPAPIDESKYRPKAPGSGEGETREKVPVDSATAAMHERFGSSVVDELQQEEEKGCQVIVDPNLSPESGNKGKRSPLL